MKSKAFITATSLMIVLLSILSSCNKTEKEVDGQKLVRLSEVVSARAERHSSYPGRTQACETSSVAFRVSGTLASIPVKAGDRVRKGQVIAQMDNRDYQTQLKATEAEYQQIKAECERIIALYKDNGTSENNYDKARYGLEQITAKYENHKNQLADCQLTAPYDAYVQEVLHEAHETVGAGMPIMTLFASSGVEIVINIPASEYQQSKLFDSFTANFSVMQGTTFPLRLKSIAKKANANQLYEVHLLLDKDAEQITPGMTAMVDILFKTDENQPVAVPTAAVFEKDGASCVFVYNPSSQSIAIRNVKIHALQNNGTILISDGLKTGEQVVASGVHHLANGELVKPTPKPSRTNVGGLL